MRHLTLGLFFAISSAVLAQNAYLTNGFVPRYWKANTGYEINVRVRNSNSTPLLTFHVDWRFNNGPVQMGNWQSTTGITGGQYWPYPHPTLFDQPASDGTLKVWVEGIGDTDHTNDTIFFPVSVLAAWATKSVLIEQYTGTWCPNCPTPNATTNTLNADPQIYVAKHHNMDEYTNAISTAYWAQYNAEFSPACVIEQGELGTYMANAAYDQWLGQTDLRKLGVSPVGITTQAEFNTTSRQLTVDVTAAFTAARTGTFTLNAYVIEDNVIGSQAAGLTNYAHHQIVREVLGGAAGTGSIIPATAAAGVAYGHQYTMTVPADWNGTNLRVIAMVSEHVNGKLATVNTGGSQVIPVGIAENFGVDPGFTVFPNPSTGQLWLSTEGDGHLDRIRVFSAEGRVVLDQRPTASLSKVEVIGFSDLEPGVYSVVVARGTRSAQRVVIRAGGTLD